MTTIPTETEVELKPGTPEYDAAMVAKFEESQGQTTETTPQRPGWLPEKFSSPEDLAAAYAELEKKQSGGTQEPVKEGTTEATTEVTEEAQKATEAAGLNFEELTTKYMADGKLADSDIEALAKVGISKEMVDAYIAGQSAIAEQYTAEIVGSVGGMERYTEVLAWAGTSLSEAEVTAFNKVVDSGDVASVKMAIMGLNARFVAENGSPPKLLTGNTAGSTDGVYTSTEQMKADMRDPRYTKDPAFRSEVAQKLSRSNIM